MFSRVARSLVRVQHTRRCLSSAQVAALPAQIDLELSVRHWCDGQHPEIQGFVNDDHYNWNLPGKPCKHEYAQQYLDNDEHCSGYSLEETFERGSEKAFLTLSRKESKSPL